MLKILIYRDFATQLAGIILTNGRVSAAEKTISRTLREGDPGSGAGSPGVFDVALTHRLVGFYLGYLCNRLLDKLMICRGKADLNPHCASFMLETIVLQALTGDSHETELRRLPMVLPRLNGILWRW